ncbi:hypothetical protein KMP13_00950 [Epibacterium ulvae]|nr:hypothetical protein [Epibacterium ulvae]MBT8152485.1 hypothetical protein [Epibacterium ulvae]
MTHKIAVWLGSFILIAAIADVVLFGDEHMIFLAKKFFELTHWMAFWR